MCLLVLSAQAEESFHLWIDFEAGATNNQLVTKAGLTNSVNLGAYALATTGIESNVFYFANPTNFGFPNSFTWGGATVTDSGTNALKIDMGYDAASGFEVYWRVTPTIPPPLSFGFYFRTTITNIAGTTPYDVLYLARTYTGALDTMVALYFAEDPPYWAAHGHATEGGFIYGMNAGDLQWVTGLATATNLTLAVYNPNTWEQYGTNSVLGGYDGAWALDYITLLEWDREAFPGCETYVDNLVINTNPTFPLIPTNWYSPQTFTWPTNTMTTLGYVEVSNAVYHATNGCTIILPSGSTNWASQLAI